MLLKMHQTTGQIRMSQKYELERYRGMITFLAKDSQVGYENGKNIERNFFFYFLFFVCVRRVRALEEWLNAIKDKKQKFEFKLVFFSFSLFLRIILRVKYK